MLRKSDMVNIPVAKLLSLSCLPHETVTIEWEGRRDGVSRRAKQLGRGTTGGHHRGGRGGRKLY